MATTDRKASTSYARPGLTAIQTADSPYSPRTPLLSRLSSSQFNSPTGSFRGVEEEHVILELGSRNLRAGYAGERLPRCVIRFGPTLQTRAGDFRLFQSSQLGRPTAATGAWDATYELWPGHPQNIDLDVLGDQLERAIRRVHTDYLIEGSKPKRTILLMSPSTPHTVLTVVISTLFEYTLAPTITLMPPATMATVAAGLRSSLVVDIGWHETTVTTVYEYREVCQRRSERATKVLCREIHRTIEAAIQKVCRDPANSENSNKPYLSFEDAEKLLERVAWCRTRTETLHEPLDPDEGQHQQRQDMVTMQYWDGKERKTCAIPFAQLAIPVEKAFLAGDCAYDALDDHEQPLPVLVFRTLLTVPIDVRSTCMANMTFTGGCASLPGLKRRLLQETQHLVATRGWNPVNRYGSAPPAAAAAAASTHRTQSASASNSNHPAGGSQSSHAHTPNRDTIDSDAPQSLPETATQAVTPSTNHTSPDSRTPTSDPITEKLQRDATKGVPSPGTTGTVRGVHSLGPWTGASMVAGLRIRGTVEIDREPFLQHGLQLFATSRGGSGGKDGDTTTGAKSRVSLAPSSTVTAATTGVAARSAAGNTTTVDKTHGVLGVWA